MINSYKYGKQLKEYLGNIQYDFIIGTHFNTNMICILNKKDIKGKIIGSEHSEYYQAGRLTRLIRALYYRKLDKFIVLTNEQKELYGRYLKNVKVINNPISFKSNEISNCENKRIITAGRLSHEKGFDRIIDIFSVISKKYSDWVLDIFGEGQQKELLQKKIKDYNLEDKIRILPFTNDIKQEFLKSGIYVLPSRNEAFSLVLLEAMECGLPSVSFDTSGPKEIITNNVDGIIIKNDDLNKFIEELEQVIMDIDIRKKYGREAKKQVKRFYIENIAKEWNGLFEEVLF